MKIENFKDLKKLIQICRAQGVDTISVDGITVELGDLPISAKRSAKTIAGGNLQELASDEIDAPDAFTDEQMLMWSAAAGGSPSGLGDN